MRGYIKYVSRKPVQAKPEIFSTGGYSGTTLDGKEVMFDWLETRANAEIRPDGRLVIEAELRDFDEEFTLDSSNKEAIVDGVTPELLTSLKLTEVFYECYADDMENFIYLDVVEFGIYDWNTEKTHLFKNLDEYNKKYSLKEDSK